MKHYLSALAISAVSLFSILQNADALSCDDIASSAQALEHARQAGVSKSRIEVFINTAYQDDMDTLTALSAIVDRSWAQDIALSPEGKRLREKESSSYWYEVCKRQ